MTSLQAIRIKKTATKVNELAIKFNKDVEKLSIKLQSEHNKEISLVYKLSKDLHANISLGREADIDYIDELYVKFEEAVYTAMRSMSFDVSQTVRPKYGSKKFESKLNEDQRKRSRIRC